MLNPFVQTTNDSFRMLSEQMLSLEHNLKIWILHKMLQHLGEFLTITNKVKFWRNKLVQGCDSLLILALLNMPEVMLNDMVECYKDLEDGWLIDKFKDYLP